MKKNINYSEKDILHDYKNGVLTIANICKKYNISTCALYNILKHNPRIKRYKKVTLQPAMLLKAIKDFETGASWKSVANQLNISVANARYYLCTRVGGSRKPRREMLFATQILQAYKNKVPTLKILSDYDISQYSLNKILKNAGLK